MSDRSVVPLTLRRLGDGDDAPALALLGGLRDQVEPAELARRLAAQRTAGYELVGAFDGDVLVGVLGMRAVQTLARGPHLHVDDLVVATSRRGAGIGAALLTFAEEDARRRGLVAVFLDSRAEVIGFYERVGYQRHAATLMRRRL